MKLLKIQVDEMIVKGNPNDMDSIKETVIEKLQVLIEKDELEFTIMEDEEGEDY